MKHSASWILWLALSIVLTLSTRNPIYLGIVIACLLLVGIYMAKNNHQPHWFSQNIRFLGTMLFISSLVNVVFTHTGSTILLRLPDHWLLVGGNITLESLVYGLINGLVIGSIFMAFNILNLALSIQQFTHLIPRALRPVAMTVSITLTFIPSIQQRTKEIKEAQIIRGNEMKKLKDWLPLLLPLLISSLENAVNLSESMTSRGFETQPDGKNTKGILINLIFAAFLIFSAWVLSLFDYPRFLTITLYTLGGCLFVGSFVSASRKINITRYRKEIWFLKDIISSGIFITVFISLIILLHFEILPSFLYSPYPNLNYPSFSLIGLLISITLLLPLLMRKND